MRSMLGRRKTENVRLTIYIDKLEKKNMKPIPISVDNEMYYLCTVPVKVPTTLNIIGYLAKNSFLK